MLKLHLVLGFMRSGKSTALLRKYEELTAAGFKVLFVRPACDTRDFIIRNLNKNDDDKLRSIVKDEGALFKHNAKDYDYILIDEVQFLSNSALVMLLDLSLNTPVIAAGLSAKAVNLALNDDLSWQNIRLLSALAADIKRLESYCACGKLASAQVFLGGKLISDDYAVCCTDCVQLELSRLKEAK